MKRLELVLMKPVGPVHVKRFGLVLWVVAVLGFGIALVVGRTVSIEAGRELALFSGAVFLFGCSFISEGNRRAAEELEG